MAAFKARRGIDFVISDLKMEGLTGVDVLKAIALGAKGTYIKKVSISSTMGPGVKLEVGTLVG